MSATTEVSPARRAVRKGPLPGPAVAAAVLGILYVALSTVSIVDLIDMRPELHSKDRQLVDIVLWITAPVMVALIVGIALVFKRRSVVVLQVIAAINAALALNNMLRSFELLAFVNLAIPALIAGLLGAQSVRQFFAR